MSSVETGGGQWNVDSSIRHETHSSPTTLASRAGENDENR